MRQVGTALGYCSPEMQFRKLFAMAECRELLLAIVYQLERVGLEDALDLIARVD